MLAAGYFRPRETPWEFTYNAQVDMTPWIFAKPLAASLFSCVIALYLLFSAVGIASGNGLGNVFYLLIAGLISANVVYWLRVSNLKKSNSI